MNGIFRYCFTAYCTACCLMLLSASPSVAQPSAVEQLSKQLKNMNSLQATFNQQIKDDTEQLLQAASGTISVKRPRRFYWNTQEPYEHLVVTDGKVLWLYDIDLEQVSKQAFTEDLDKAPALLLSGEVDQIASQYKVSIIPELKPNKTNSTTYELLPIKEGGLFSRLTVTFNDGKLSSMSFLDSFDQQTSIEFNDVKLNLQIDDTLFQFKAPDGVDVITDS